MSTASDNDNDDDWEDASTASGGDTGTDDNAAPSSASSSSEEEIDLEVDEAFEAARLKSLPKKLAAQRQKFVRNPSYDTTITLRLRMATCVVPEGTVHSWPLGLHYDLWRDILCFVYSATMRMQLGAKKKPAGPSEEERAKEESKLTLFALQRTGRAFRYLCEREPSWGVSERRQHELCYKVHTKDFTPKDKNLQMSFFKGLQSCDAAHIAKLLLGMPNKPLFNHDTQGSYNITNRLLSTNCLQLYRVRNPMMPDQQFELRYLLNTRTFVSKYGPSGADDSILLERFGDIDGKDFSKVILPAVHVDRLLSCLDALMAAGWCDPAVECVVCYALVNLPKMLSEADTKRLLTGLVVDRGFSVNLGTIMSGMTPLHRAVRHQMPWLVEWLLNHGADATIPLARTHTDHPDEIHWFSHGATAVDCARHLYYEDISNEKAKAMCQLLADHGHSGAF